MPRPAINDYTFYMIVNINADVELCYVGSTCNMAHRQRCHKYNSNNPSSNRYHLKLYEGIREYGGWDEFKMVEIATIPQITLPQANAIEEEYRVELKADMNSKKCYRTKEYTSEYRRIHTAKGYIKNKDIILSRQKEYYKKKSEKVLCDCGCYVSKLYIKKHQQTQKHTDLMSKL